LVSWWKVFICSLLSLLSKMNNYYLWLLIWFNRGIKYEALLHRGKTAPISTCNPVHFTVFKPSY
jgi:hypothetical protein